MITKPQITIIHVLLAKRGLKEEKAGIVLTYTNDRSSHVSEMSKKEAATLIQHLSGESKFNNSVDRGEKQRRYIIAMARQMGWTTTDGRADMVKINSWIAKYGHLNSTGKNTTLNSYKAEHLTKLVSQFQQVLKSNLKAFSI